MASTISATETRSPSQDSPEPGRATDRVLLIEAGGRTFAVPASEVREIVPFRSPTRLPGAPAFVLGILNLRGTLVTVIDLATRLNLPTSASENRCIVLLSRDGRPAGVTVDFVRDVMELDDDLVEKTGDEAALSELTTGLARLDSGLVLLLDVKLLVKQALL